MTSRKSVMWVYPLVMTEIIFSSGLSCFIKGFSIWFEKESIIDENRSYGLQTWPWMKHEARGHWGGLADPRGRPSSLPWSPFGSIFGRHGPLFITSWISWFLMIGSHSVVVVCFPHTCFLLSFMHNMWRQTYTQKNTKQIIITRLH